VQGISLAVVSALLALGCAGAQKPIAVAAAPSLKGKQILTTVQKTPAFRARTAAKVAFGPLAGRADWEIVESYGIKDPALQVSRDLLQLLQGKYGLEAMGGPTQVDLEDVGALLATRGRADLVLDVKTLFWQFIYYPTHWGRYRVQYSVRARLIDVKAREVVAEGTAGRIQDDLERAPSYDELLESDAARLKAELKRQAAECTEELARTIFDVGAPPPKASPSST